MDGWVLGTEDAGVAADGLDALAVEAGVMVGAAEAELAVDAVAVLAAG